MNEQLNDVIQIAALILELIGFSLAGIEIRSTAFTGRVRSFMHKRAAILPSDPRLYPFNTGWGNLALGGFFFCVLLFQVAEGGVWTLIGFSLVCCALPAVSFRAAMDWVPGREVGTMGLILAGVGLILEVYQAALMF